MRYSDIEADYLQDTIKCYDEQAKVFQQNVQDRGNLIDEYEKFLSLIPGKKVLDLGSGSGRDLKYFLEQGCDAYGIEISQGLVAVCDDDIFAGKIIVDDMLHINKYFSGSSIDGIWSMASILHMGKEYGKLALKKSYELLVDEGVLLLSIKIRKTGDEEEILKESQTMPGVKKRYIYYAADEMTEILESIGFVIQDVSYKDHIGGNDLWGIFVSVKK